MSASQEKKVILFPSPKKNSKPPDRLPNPDCSHVLPLPPKKLTSSEAIRELKRLLGSEGDNHSLVFLEFPDMVNSYVFPGGVEFYDVKTVRPSEIRPDEILEDVNSWVNCWYLSVFENNGKLIGRYINRDFPKGPRVIERPILDPEAGIENYTVDSFLEAVIHGDSPEGNHTQHSFKEPRAAAEPMGPIITLSLPRNANAYVDPIAAAAMLEKVATLGKGMPDSPSKRAEVAKKMDELKRCEQILENVIRQHAAKYCDRAYERNDPNLDEQIRVNVLLTVAIYAIDSIKMMYPRVRQLDDAGVSSLFERALDAALKVFSQDFYQQEAKFGARDYIALVELPLIASLRLSGLSARVTKSIDLYNTYKGDTKQRIIDAIRMLDDAKPSVHIVYPDDDKIVS